MKHTKLFFAAVLVLTAVCVSAKADMNAIDIVAQFNSMNGGAGFRFTSDVSNPLVTATAQTGYANVDVSAYATGRGGTASGKSYFTTFCVQPNYTAVSPALGRLNFNAANGQTINSSGTALSLGAATLYKQYATGQLAVTSTANANAFSTALKVLNGSETLANWSTNAYLATLTGSQNYWTQKYDARQRYNEIGDYCVFVMQVTDSSGNRGQDFLYLANATYTKNHDVPEPATMLLWALGGLGVAGSTWTRKRRMKKLALS